MNDYLSTLPSWAPGEFARRQAEFDATLTALSEAMAPCLLEPLRKAVAGAADLVQFTDKGLRELALDEAFLLANYIWSGWREAVEEQPSASRCERLSHASQYALRHSGWSDEGPDLAVALSAALEGLSPGVLPEVLPN